MNDYRGLVVGILTIHAAAAFIAGGAMFASDSMSSAPLWTFFLAGLDIIVIIMVCK